MQEYLYKIFIQEFQILMNLLEVMLLKDSLGFEIPE
jgi:hypothetical protein